MIRRDSTSAQSEVVQEFLQINLMELKETTNIPLFGFYTQEFFSSDIECYNDLSIYKSINSNALCFP